MFSTVAYHCPSAAGSVTGISVGRGVGEGGGSASRVNTVETEGRLVDDVRIAHQRDAGVIERQNVGIAHRIPARHLLRAILAHAHAVAEPAGFHDE